MEIHRKKKVVLDAESESASPIGRRRKFARGDGFSLSSASGDEEFIGSLTYNHIFFIICAWSVLYGASTIVRAVNSYDPFEKGLSAVFAFQILAVIAFFVAFFLELAIVSWTHFGLRVASLAVALLYFCLSCYLLSNSKENSRQAGYRSAATYVALWVFTAIWCLFDMVVHLVASYASLKLSKNL